MSNENKNTEVVKKDNKKGNKKPNAFVRFFKAIGRKFKEVFSELKKVTWPTFPTVLKQLSAVLVIVVLMLVILMLFDLGLQQLLKLVRGTAEVVSEVL
jgi:preprotein translocase subunit SecE